MSDTKDTLRILISWKCNLKCSYCCNEIPRFREQIKPTAMNAIRWHDYKAFCISGGEPLLDLVKVAEVVARIPKGAMIILYTNGTLLTAPVADALVKMGIKAVNVGLHNPYHFRKLIVNVSQATSFKGLHVRFHAQDIHRLTLEREFPWASFRFWKMDDCDRSNEDRVVVNDWSRPQGLTI